MAFNIGTVTDQARKKTALPFPSQPYAGTAPLSGAPASPYAPTPTPTTVSTALQNTNQTVDQAKTALNATQPFLDHYLKPNAAGTTPFRQALTNTKSSETAQAYDNAISNVRSKAEASGLATRGQPVSFGAEAGLANDRAKAIADIPNKVNIEAQPVEFQAAQMQQSQAPILNALANTQQGEAGILNQQQMQKDAQKAALASGLATTGISVGVPLIKAALTKAAPAAAGVGGTAAATGAAASLPGVAAGAVPALPTLGATAVPGVTALGTTAAAPATGITGALGLGGGSGLFGLGAATIPVVGGIIAGGALLANHFIGQGRKAADKLTGQDGIQHAFEETLNQIDQAPGYTPEQKWQSKEQAYDQLEKLGIAFAQKGSHEHLVASQMFDEISHLFGRPNPLKGVA